MLVDGRPRKARQSPSGLAGSASPSDPNPSVASRHLPAQRGVTPLRGAPFARAKPAREASPSGEVAAEQAGRVQPVDGGHSKVAGRACPAPTDCRESLCTRGAREGGSPPLQVGGSYPGMGGDARPVGTLQASQARPAPLMGRLLRGQSPRRKPPLSKRGAERKRGGGIPGRLRG